MAAAHGAQLGGGCALVVRPVAVPALDFDHRLIRHDRSHRDAADEWLREMLAQALA